MSTMTTGFHRAQALLALLVLWAVGLCTAAFQTSFVNVTQGQQLRLTWDSIDDKYYPLALSARLINRTAENKVNGVLLNLST